MTNSERPTCQKIACPNRFGHAYLMSDGSYECDTCGWNSDDTEKAI